MNLLADAIESVRAMQPLKFTGRAADLRGLTVLVDDLALPIGSLVRIGSTLGEIVGFSRERAIVMLLGQSGGIRPGDSVVGEQVAQMIGVGRQMLGRVLNGLGQPIDGKGPLRLTSPRPLSPRPLGPMERKRITLPLFTGIRAIDLMTPLGRGQRMGVFAGPGVGKSTLIGQIARRTSADINVIGLIGERGREVKDFIEHSLGPTGLAKSVVIVATGDESPLMRLRAAKAAATTAEYFRDDGLDVLLIMDSITRFAHAQRQIGLSVGEPPATKGYTPSVFAQMSLVLERAGAVERMAGRKAGSVTGLYTILVEGDDMTEPVADAARGILDGHIILSRKLAQRAHYPAIDVLDSISRVAGDVLSQEHTAARSQIVRLLAMYREVEDLVQIGAYAKGSNPDYDVAIEMEKSINMVLRQDGNEVTAFEDARAVLLKLAAQSQEMLAKLGRKKAG